MSMLFSLLLTTSVLSQTPSAQAAHAEAIALTRAELWKEALEALDRAVVESPAWAPPYYLRARVRERLGLTPALEAASRSKFEGFDYPAGKRLLAAIVGDYETFLKLSAPDATERETALQGLAQRQATLTAISRLEQAEAEELERRRVAAEAQRRQEEANRRAEAERQQLAARQARETAERLAKEEARAELEASWQAGVDGARHLRLLGIGSVAAGAIAGGTAIALLVASNGRIGAIQGGTLPQGSDIEVAASQAGTLRTAALVFMLSAIVLVGVGAPLFLMPKDPARPEGLGLFVTSRGALLTFGGVLP